MEANSDQNLEIPGEMLSRIIALYPKLTEAVPGTNPTQELPSPEELMTSVGECSFKIFPDPDSYFRSERAKQYLSWSSSRCPETASDLYRIYFNEYSGKIYVDLNGTRFEEARTQLQDEIVYCEILRTLIFVLTCDVARVETVVAEETPAEVVIPPATD